ncbi:MAG TPA: hypothetical protein VEX38_07625, partial [Fimbriimonadaceae bacterium]|nr:hypothetical protein [Fimbriimonadaceae bacterium]
MKAKNRILGLILALLALVGTASAASVRTNGGQVFVNEMLVLTLRSGKPESIAKRAQGVAASLRPLDGGSTVSVLREGKSVRVVLGSQSLFFVSPQEAAAAGKSQGELAEIWVQNLRRALALPPISINSNSVRLPRGGQTKIEILGSRVADARIQTSDPNIVTAGRAPGVLVLKSTGGFGDATITISAGDVAQAISVRVLP